MSSIMSITQTPKGLYTQEPHYSKMEDNVKKYLTLTSKNKEKLHFGFEGNWGYVQGDEPYCDMPDWWYDFIPSWDLEYYKPIRVEERLNVSINCDEERERVYKVYKQHFWIKKVLLTQSCKFMKMVQFDVEGMEEATETYKYDSYAVCYGKKNGVYNIIKTDCYDSNGFFACSTDDNYEEEIKDLPYQIDVSNKSMWKVGGVAFKSQ